MIDNWGKRKIKGKGRREKRSNGQRKIPSTKHETLNKSE
jgi:hypothetical protein